MKACGKVKFFDSKKKKFGFIVIENTENGFRTDDAIFFEDDRRGKWSSRSSDGLLVIFDLIEKGKKLKATNVYPFLQAPDDMLLEFLDLFDSYQRITILNNLISRDYKIDKKQIVSLFNKAANVSEYPYNLQQFWTLVKSVNQQYAYDLFFDHTTQKMFGTDSFYKYYINSASDWFFKNGLNEFYTEQAITQNHPVLVKLFTLYSQNNVVDVAKEILSLILPQISEIKHPVSIIYLLNYVDSPKELLEKNVTDLSTTLDILSSFQVAYKNDRAKNKAELILTLLRKIKDNGWLLNVTQIRELLELEIELGPELAQYFISSVLSTTPSEGEEWKRNITTSKYFSLSVIIAHLLKYVDNPYELLDKSVTDISIANNILQGLQYYHKNSLAEITTKLIITILTKIKANSWILTGYRTRELLELKLALEPEIVRYYVFNLLKTSFSEGEFRYIQNYIFVSANFPSLKSEILHYSLFELKIESIYFFTSLSDEDLDQKMVDLILNRFPTILSDQPEFFIRLSNIPGLTLTKVNLDRIHSQFIKSVLDNIGEDHHPLRDQIINYFLRLLEKSDNDQNRYKLLFNFFFADIRIVYRIHLHNKGFFSWNLIKSTNKETYKLSRNPEIQFLLAMLGLLDEADINFEKLNFHEVLFKLDSSFEFAVIKFLSWITMRNIRIREKFKSFILNTDLKSFPSIVFKNFVSLGALDEKSAVSALNKSLLEGFLKLKDAKHEELAEYFSLRVLVRRCSGRKYTSTPTRESIRGKMEVVVKEYSNRTNPVVDYCEGRYWKKESYLVLPDSIRKTYDLYWCRGAVCIEPNRKINTNAPFVIYSLHELMLSFGMSLSDLVYGTIAGWMNRLKELLPLLKCNECNFHLVPVSYVPNNLGYYATPLFMCPNQSCSEYQKNIRFTHCINCGTVLDSRELDTCSNGWMECPNCKACCPQHSGKSYTPHYRQT